jgi:hypothetical protein
VRRTIVLVLAMALLCSAWVGASAGPVAAGPTDPTVTFGSNAAPKPGQSKQQGVTSLESQMGRKLTVVRVYWLWDQPFPDSHINWLLSTGHTLYLSVKAKRTNGQNIAWRAIADAQPGSALHNDIVAWATKVKNLGVKTYFAFHHEPEAAANIPHGTAADFIAAWQKVVAIFRGQGGVTNAQHIWTMTAHAFRVNDRRAAHLWFPGDAHIDGLGVDAYNWYTCRNDGVFIAWQTLQSIIEPFRQFALVHPGKKVMVAEWASVEDPQVPGRKAQWIADVRALFKSSGYERFTATLYFNRNDTKYAGCRWWADTSQSSLDALRAMANDVYYTAGP